MDTKKTGRLIAQLRKEKGLTQSQLANELNISSKTVSKWECGYGVPDASVWAELAKVLEADIEKAIQDGKVRMAGISCYYIKETDRFLPQVTIKPALIQNEIHPYYQDSKVIRHIQNLDIAVQSWYPLGGRGYNHALLQDKVLREIAEIHGKTLPQVILRWDLQRGVVVIPGSSNPDHIRENISIFDFTLSKEEMEAIASLERKEKHDWY